MLFQWKFFAAFPFYFTVRVIVTISRQKITYYDVNARRYRLSKASSLMIFSLWSIGWKRFMIQTRTFNIIAIIFCLAAWCKRKCLLTNPSQWQISLTPSWQSNFVFLMFNKPFYVWMISCSHTCHVSLSLSLSLSLSGCKQHTVVDFCPLVTP